MRGIIVFALVFLAAAPAQARNRQQHHQAVAGPTFSNGLWTYQAAVPAPVGTVIVHRHAHARHLAANWRERMFRHLAARPQRSNDDPVSIAANGLVAPLAAKVAEITHTCGSRLISAVRHTYIAGTRHMSLHAFGKAADVSGNAPCIYRMLADWPGGYSVDYSSVGHVHISYDQNGREWGSHFRHYAISRRWHNYGRRHHYASHHYRRKT